MGRGKSRRTAVSTISGSRRVGLAPVRLHEWELLDERYRRTTDDAPVFDFNAGPGVAALRAALGLSQQQALWVHLLVDRSGSIVWDNEAGTEQVRLAEEFTTFDTGPNSVAISGYDGDPSRTEIYQVKPFEVRTSSAIHLLPALGGTGDATVGAISYGADTFISGLDEKLLVLATDAGVSNIEDCARAVASARARGVRVIAACKVDSAADYPNLARALDERFGDDWFTVQSYADTATALVEHLNAASSSDYQFTEEDLRAQEMGEAVFSAGEDASSQFVAAHSESADRMRRLSACYLRTRLRDPKASPETALATAARIYNKFQAPDVTASSR